MKSHIHLYQRLTFTTKAPREGNRTPMNKIKRSEERYPETGFSYHHLSAVVTLMQTIDLLMSHRVFLI